MVQTNSTTTNMSQNALTLYSKDDLMAVLKMFGRTPETIQEDIDAVKNWIKTQPHFPEIPDDSMIKTFLVLNKCSIEITKQKLDNYYSIRHFTWELFSHHPLDPEMRRAYKIWYYVTLPKLCGLDRVIVFKFKDNDPEKFEAELLFSHLLNTIEIRLFHDCCHKDIVIFDFTGAKVAHLMKTTTLLLKIQTIVENVYSTRVRAIHIIHAFDLLINTMKSVLKQKLRDRIHVHKGYDSLFEHLPKEVLPEDFGGGEKSLEKIAEIQLKMFEQNKDRFDMLRNLKSKEELRPGKAINDEFFGFYGNFKQINVD